MADTSKLLVCIAAATIIAGCGGGGSAAPSTTASGSPSASAPQASTALVAPALPTSLASSAPSATHVVLSWTDNTSGAAKYRIFRNGSVTALAEVDATNYTDYTTNASTTYTYQIQAVDGINSSNLSTTTAFPSVTTPATNSTILASSDFETSNFAGWSGQEFAAVPHAYQFVSTPNPVRSGSKALRIELHSTDPDVAGSKRAELVHMGTAQNGEYWYAFSIYLPSDYAYDRSQEILAQWHNYPDFSLGETWMSPPLAIGTKNDRWVINRLWDDAPVSTNSSVYAKGFGAIHDLGSVVADKGRWVDWVFHIKWGWLTSQGPILEVYKNGALVLNQNGLPNTTNDVIAPYFKIGIYKWDWKQDPLRSDLTTRVLYIDRMMIGNSNSTLRDMQ